MCKASIAAVLLALGIVSLVQEGTNAMVALPAGLRPALTMPAVETVALRKSVTVTRHVAVRHRGVTVRTRHVAVRHRGVTRTRHVAGGHRGVMVRTRHVAVRHRSVAARRTHVAMGRRGAVAVKSTAVERPVRPWVLQPYYGTVFDGVTLGAVIAATAVPTSPSFDLSGIGRIPPRLAAIGTSANSSSMICLDARTHWSETRTPSVQPNRGSTSPSTLRQRRR